LKYLSKPLNRFLAVSGFQRLIYTQRGLIGFTSYINEPFMLFSFIVDPPSSSDIIHHPLPVYFRVKPALRTPSGKRCRKSRTVFTDLQLRVLEKTFSEQRYLDSTNRAKLSHILGLNEAQVKTWFQNRRMKWKKKVAKNDKPDSSTTSKKAEKSDSAVGKNNKETATNEREKTSN